MEHVHLLPKPDQVLVKKIARIIEQWKGKIVTRVASYRNLLKDEYNGLLEVAPFDATLGCNYEDRTLFLCVAEGCSANLAGLIHEAGHVFACYAPPMLSDEFEFFGWEYQFAKSLKILSRWYAENRDYAVDYNNDFTLDKCAQGIKVSTLSKLQDIGFKELGEITPKNRSMVFRERVMAAKEQGILTKDNVLCTVRT